MEQPDRFLIVEAFKAVWRLKALHASAPPPFQNKLGPLPVAYPAFCQRGNKAGKLAGLWLAGNEGNKRHEFT